MRYWILIAVIILLGCILILAGCSENYQARQGGGTMTIKLPPGQKFINATWKDNDLWYLTRSMHAGEQAESFTFQEKSNLGIIEGKVVFEESAPK